jgi:hypothetical protein
MEEEEEEDEEDKGEKKNRMISTKLPAYSS